MTEDNDASRVPLRIALALALALAPKGHGVQIFDLFGMGCKSSCTSSTYVPHVHLLATQNFALQPVGGSCSATSDA